MSEFFVNNSMLERQAVRSFLSSFARKEFQVLGAVLFAVAVPSLVRFGFSDIYLKGYVFQNTFVGSVGAIIAGVYLYSSVSIFPGGERFWYMFSALSLSFIAIILVFFSFRLDYSLYVLFFAYLISFLWLLVCMIVREHVVGHSVAIVPGGGADRLLELPGVEWQSLDKPILGDKHFEAIVADLRVDFSSEWERLLTEAALKGIPVFYYKQIYESLTGRVEIEHLSENTLGSIIPNRTYLVVKRIFDFLLAVLVLIVCAPMFVFLALLVKIDSSGPALFRQRRMGFKGKEFTVYKLRTMRTDQSSAGDERQRAMTKDEDPRITKLGRVLRRTRLDELPQVINILKGEMSWIGPRPEAVALSKWYEEELPFYQYRHIVRPGITGWAQVMQGHVTSKDDVLEKLYYDFYYIKNFSFWLDVFIVAKTIRIVATGFGAR